MEEKEAGEKEEEKKKEKRKKKKKKAAGVIHADTNGKMAALDENGGNERELTLK